MIIILDCGSQLTLNIARRIREHNVFCEIIPFDSDTDSIKGKKPDGIVISGGPANINEPGAPLVDKSIFGLGIPVLGICYGMQCMGKLLGGAVDSGSTREFGKAELMIKDKENPLFSGLPDSFNVWMSHGDSVSVLPTGFSCAANSSGIENASIWDSKRSLFGVQFHPEVDHTEHGRKILENFIEACGCSRDWKMEDFIKLKIKEIKETVGDSIVIGGVSGGVDSTVASAIMYSAIGDRFSPIFINNGLLRKDEPEEVIDMFKSFFHNEPIYVDATEKFLSGLKGVSDPEEKRKIIGKVFIEVFSDEAKRQSDAKFLMQGTLYPDVIESTPVFGGPSSTIKSHHNVGGLPKDMHLKLIEPFRYLFKDEVRKIGEILGLPKTAIWRHPFPGPGLAVRILGEITKPKLEVLRKADHIFIEELERSGEYYNIWQAFSVLLPVKSVGVMGDERTYENAVVLRAVTSNDTMTADWAKLPYKVLETTSGRIINEVKGINRVAYDISQKPPATIEWE